MALFGNRRAKNESAESMDAPQVASVASEGLPPEGTARKTTRRKRKKTPVSNLIATLILFVGLGICLYPSFSNWANNYQRLRDITEYVDAVAMLDQRDIDRMLREARSYNKRLVNKANRFNMSDADIEEYNSILDFTGKGVIGYIQISNLGVNLPIYHGTSDEVLQTAIGHIQGTSFPVGGKNTHSAVSGHRGLPSARLFTDIDKMVEGDTFTITVLNETYTYLVDQIRIVEPGDLSELNIVRKEDLVTLVTCTPYGVNTHRLLVRGHRIDNLADALAIPAEAIQIPNYIAVAAVAIPFLFIYLAGLLIYLRTRQPNYNREEILAEIRELEAKGELDVWGERNET